MTTTTLDTTTTTPDTDRTPASSTAGLRPDSLPVLVFAVAVTAGLALVSFALSFAGLVHVARWAAVPDTLTWAVPVVVDGAQLVFTAGMLVHRARGESVARSWAALVLFAAVSVAGNGMHAWDAGTGDWRTWVGVVVAGLAPVAVVLSVHELASLILRRRPTSAQATTSADSAARPTATYSRRSTIRTPELVARCHELRDAGHSIRSIAATVGVSRWAVTKSLERAD